MRETGGQRHTTARYFLQFAKCVPKAAALSSLNLGWSIVQVGHYVSPKMVLIGGSCCHLVWRKCSIILRDEVLRKTEHQQASTSFPRDDFSLPPLLVKDVYKLIVQIQRVWRTTPHSLKNAKLSNEGLHYLSNEGNEVLHNLYVRFKSASLWSRENKDKPKEKPRGAKRLTWN